jgi:hypothetical protein
MYRNWTSNIFEGELARWCLNKGNGFEGKMERRKNGNGRKPVNEDKGKGSTEKDKFDPERKIQKEIKKY